MTVAGAEPSFAERARTLVHRGRVGALATLSRRVSGFPFGSVAPYGSDGQGNPILLLSALAMHTQNLAADDRVSVLVNDTVPADEALASARVTLMGRARLVAPEEVVAVRTDYLERHEAARAWVDFKDFGFYRLDVSDVYYVGGFGSMGWVDAEAYHAAAVDPLADQAAGILEHMNTDHSDAVLLYARVLAGIAAEKASMVAIDRLGFHVRAESGDQTRTVRLGFATEVRSTDDARQALIELLRSARAANRE